MEKDFLNIFNLIAISVPSVVVLKHPHLAKI